MHYLKPRPCRLHGVVVTSAASISIKIRYPGIMNKYIQIFPIILLLLSGCSPEQEAEAQAPAVAEVTGQPVESTGVESVGGIALPAGFSATLFAEGFVISCP